MFVISRYLWCFFTALSCFSINAREEIFSARYRDVYRVLSVQNRLLVPVQYSDTHIMYARSGWWLPIYTSRCTDQRSKPIFSHLKYGFAPKAAAAAATAQRARTNIRLLQDDESEKAFLLHGMVVFSPHI